MGLAHRSGLRQMAAGRFCAEPVEIQDPFAAVPYCLPSDVLYVATSITVGAQMAKGALNPIDRYVGSRVRMRRLMLDMSQSNIATALGLTFQQVQKYEKGSNRISASRLQHLSQILQVPVPFFFEGAPAASAGPVAKTPPAGDLSSSYVSDFLATSEGLALVKAFACIEDAKLRRAIVRLVEELVLESE
jgi:transcriptional regulator with XRE-family HTH domain